MLCYWCRCGEHPDTRGVDYGLAIELVIHSLDPILQMYWIYLSGRSGPERWIVVLVKNMKFM